MRKWILFSGGCLLLLLGLLWCLFETKPIPESSQTLSSLQKKNRKLIPKNAKKHRPMKQKTVQDSSSLAAVSVTDTYPTEKEYARDLGIRKEITDPQKIAHALITFGECSQRGHELLYDKDGDGELNDSESFEMFEAERNRAMRLEEWVKENYPSDGKQANPAFFTDIERALSLIATDMYSEFDMDESGDFDPIETEMIGESFLLDLESGYDDDQRLIDYINRAHSSK